LQARHCPQALIHFASRSPDELRLRERSSCRGQYPSQADISAVAQLALAIVVKLVRGPANTRVHDIVPHPDFLAAPRENDLALNCDRGARHAVPTTAVAPSGSAFTIKNGPLFWIGTMLSCTF